MFVGIDGGGSKTLFLLCNSRGVQLASCTLPSSHYQQVGFDSYRSTLQQGLVQLCQQANCNLQDLEFITVGVPGYGESLADTQTLDAFAAEVLPCPYELLNDVKLAWAGALACRPGVCILSGTGSMAWAVDPAGNDLRCGGWGEKFGDEGSAYWLGLECCKLFSKMSDGRCQRGPLYHIIREQLGFQEDFELINYVYDMKEQRSELARMALYLHRAFEEGDPAAAEVFAQAARELGLLVKGILQSYPEPEGLSVSYNGGVFRAGPAFIQLLQNALKELGLAVALHPPRLSPVAGACLYSALRCSSLSGLDKQAFLATLSLQDTAKPGI